MPISDELLLKEKNRFIAVKGEATVAQVAAVLKKLEGQSWWHVVVRLDDGSWGTARFNELLASIESISTAAETQLRALKTLRAANATERAIDENAAKALARKSPARVLVVTDQGRPVGILVEGVTRGAAPPGPPGLSAINLDTGAKPVDLTKYGSILLGSSKKS